MSRRYAGLVLAWVLMATGCGDLPAASEGPVHLTLWLRIPPLFVFEQTLIEVDVLDSSGRTVTGVPIRWSLGSDQPLEIVDVGPDGLLVQATSYGSTTVRAAVEPSFGRYVADTVAQQVLTRYMEPFDVSFVGVGRDTVITSGGTIELRAQAIEGHGEPMVAGEFSLRGSPEWSQYRSQVWTDVTADSMELVAVIRHSLAPGLADTVDVHVRRQVAIITLSPVTLTSVGDTAILDPQAKDGKGNPFPSDIIALALADPADSAIIDISGRKVVARAAGTARVVAAAGEARDTAIVDVAPIARTLSIQGAPTYFDLFGATAEVTSEAFDARGNLVVEPAGPTTWTVSGSAITAAPSGPHSATVTAVAPGTSTLTAQLPGCEAGCALIEAAVPISVIPRLDSVVVSTVFDTLTFLGATTQLSLTGYYQDAPMPTLPATWTALDPATATVDSAGLVTAVLAGSARFVGAVAGHADTATIVVIQVPSSLVVDSVPALIIGTVDTLTATLYDGGGSPIPGPPAQWSSDAPGIVAVDASGVITAASEGHATITATLGGESVPLVVVSLDPAYTLMPSNDDICVVAAGGSVYCGLDRLRPVRLSPAAMLIEGDSSYCALGGPEDGSCMGNNADGQLGVGHLNYVGIPTPILTSDTLVTVAVVGEGHEYAHSCGIARDGRALCWGEQRHFQLGTASRTPLYQTYPVEVETDLRFADIALCDGRTCGIATDSTGYCWGMWETGETPEPQRVVGADDMVDITAGGFFFCGLTAAGEVRCWGENYSGQLGDGTYARHWTADPVAGSDRFLAVDAGYSHACGLTDAGTLMCWGDNSLAQLGDGTFTGRPQPVLALGGRTFTALAVGGTLTAARDAAGELILWGGPTYPDRVRGTPPPAIRTLVKAPGG